MGWGIATHQVSGQSISSSQAISLQLPPAWNPRCLRHENGSNRTQRSTSQGLPGECGWGSSSPGNLGLPAGGPGVVAGGEGRGASQEPG